MNHSLHGVNENSSTELTRRSGKKCIFISAFKLKSGWSSCDTCIKVVVMTIERSIANFFRLNERNWMRHSNPWSVWTRYSVLPLIVLAFWSRMWIGWWCLFPGLLSILWVFFNPVFLTGRAQLKIGRLRLSWGKGFI